MRALSAAALVVAFCSVSTEAQSFTDDQVNRGRTLWLNQDRAMCTQCHTVDNETAGNRRPLAGPGSFARSDALSMNAAPLNTAADISDFIASQMPRGRPGTIRQSEALVLVAFILSKNDVRSDGVELTRENAESIVLDKVLPQRQRPWGRYAGIVAGIVVCLLGVVFLVRRQAQRA